MLNKTIAILIYTLNTVYLQPFSTKNGCGWHFEVNLTDEISSYVASDASNEKVNALISQARDQYGIYVLEVEMSFELTGKKKKVMCGWGKTPEFDEINIQEIRVLR